MERQKIRLLVKSLPLLGPLLVGGLLAVGSAEAQGIRYIIPPDINVCTTCHPYDAPLSAGTTVVFSDGHQEIFPDGLNLPTRAWLNEHDPQAAKQVYAAAGLIPPEGQFSSQYYPHIDQPAEWPSANQFVTITNQGYGPNQPLFDISGPNAQGDYELSLPGTKPLDSFSTDTKRMLLASTLNSDLFRTENYARAIQTWPKDVAIWPFLNSFSAQKNFIKYIGTIDRAKNNPYVKKNRDWVCEDFALQFYLQFSSFDVRLNPPLFASPSAYDPSDQIRLNPQRADLKLRMPVYYVSIDKNDDLSWGHAMNAIQVGTDSTRFESFYFLEPQGDWHPNLGNPGFPVNSVIGIYQELTIGTEDYIDYPIARFQIDKQGVITACPNLSQFSPCTN